MLLIQIEFLKKFLNYITHSIYYLNIAKTRFIYLFQFQRMIVDQTTVKFRIFLFIDSINVAEIIWCLNIIVRHLSIRSGGASVQVFPKMFPGSEIAEKMQLSRTKISYHPYFRKELFNVCSGCFHFVIASDESLNKISQHNQMNVSIRFWSDDKQQVVTRYYPSEFLNTPRLKIYYKRF